jgi:two-component system NtrC family response regulator
MMTGEAPALLIVEDDPGLQAQLKWAWDGFDVRMAGTRDEAVAQLRSNPPDIVTLDLGLPPHPDGVEEGFAVLDAVFELAPHAKVIVASGHNARESALTAIERGAYDYYHKPIDIESLKLIVSRALALKRIEAENRELARQATRGGALLSKVISGAPRMLDIARSVERTAATRANVLVLGASGTGKSLLARALHGAAGGLDESFVTINCAALDEEQLDRELFDDSGRIRAGNAEPATLFMREIADLSSPLQAKLLRYLDERASRPPADDAPRIVSATNRDIQAAAADGAFREDLLYRLAEVVIHLPSLTDRPGDTMLLARHFLKRFAREMNAKVAGFAPSAATALANWEWPGNVRELENRVRRAVIMCEDRYITPADLDLSEQGESMLSLDLKKARGEADCRLIRQAMAQTGNNVSQAAKLLGISRPTLYDLLKQYGIEQAA